jgi:hypothetical protein
MSADSVFFARHFLLAGAPLSTVASGVETAADPLTI